MDLYKRLFNVKVNGKKMFDNQSKETIEIENRTDLGGGPFVVCALPNLENIFCDPNPPPCFKPSDYIQNYWNKSDIKYKRTILAIAYLQHINFICVLKTMNFLDGMRSYLLTLVLHELLIHPYEKISEAAAKALWKCEEDNNCESIVKIFKDEIEGRPYSKFYMSREKAIEAMDILVKSAPNEAAKIGIQKIIEEKIVIEERIKEANISTVQFVAIEKKDGLTYEVYSARNMTTAKGFLKNKVVSQSRYYIEVETPEGNVGKDIKGMYTL